MAQQRDLSERDPLPPSGPGSQACSCPAVLETSSAHFPGSLPILFHQKCPLPPGPRPCPRSSGSVLSGTSHLLSLEGTSGDDIAALAAWPAAIGLILWAELGRGPAGAEGPGERSGLWTEGPCHCVSPSLLREKSDATGGDLVTHTHVHVHTCMLLACMHIHANVHTWPTHAQYMHAHTTDMPTDVGTHILGSP